MVRQPPLTRDGGRAWQLVAAVPGLRALSPGARRLLIAVLLVLAAAFGVSQLLQERLARHLVDKVVESQRIKVAGNVRRLDLMLREAEQGVIRYAALISEAPQPSSGSDLQPWVRRDPDGALRTPRQGFDATRQAALWIPPDVPLTQDNRRFFLHSLLVTRLFGMGAADDLLVNSWVLPLTNGEVIYWPANPDFVSHAAADLDYRQTPWVQLTNPSGNPRGLARWTDPDYDPAARQWLLSVVAPFRRQGRWAGSVGHDILLTSLLRGLEEDQTSAIIGVPAASAVSVPLYVVGRGQQLLARWNGVPLKGERLPARFRPFLRKQADSLAIGVFPDGRNYVLVAPIPSLRAKAIYEVRGDWIHRTLSAELTGLQVLEALVLSVLMGSALAIALRESQHRRSEQQLLQERNRDLERLVQERTAALENAHQRLKQEVLLASRIQRDLLVSERELAALTPGLEIGAVMVPSKEVGGDLYDCIALGKDRFLLCIGDVAGKGMPAALLMSTCLSLLRSYAEVFDSPAAIVRRLNQRLCHNNPDCAFTTFLVAVLDQRSGELRWCNAGHTPMLLLRRGEVPTPLRVVHGPALGVVEGCTYGESRLQLAEGDALFLYTDGVIETTDRQGGRFGLFRLIALLQGPMPQASRQLVRTLLRDLRLYADGETQRDDITILVVRRQAGPAADPDPHRLDLRIANAVDSLQGVKQHLLDFCAHHEIAPGLRRRLMVVVDELLNNSIRHGCQGLADQASISLRIEYRQGRVELELRDNGKPPFNPLDASTPDLDGDVQERELGGLGIHLVRRLSSAISYRFEAGFNVITLQMES